MNVATQDTVPDNLELTHLARASATELSQLLRERPDSDRAHIKLDGADLVLPRQALVLLRDLLTEMAQGNAVTILPTHAEVTTQEAANMLNVSRPHLVKLLEEGAVPFSRVGTHRRIRLQDLLAYKRQQEEVSEAALQELADQAQDLDMGY
ncbi:MULTISPECIES: helix-turn-helix domain-containing protein [Halomonas]|uniref:Excisionase family DNA-binding protein n=2 Tax=Halomonas TaxID=2745 RepID=A0A7X4W187_9GAMM|nr:MULTISPECIES: helix-turn-helix domain-containing protein [Halomonas]MDR5903632.1 helix-turn-helix domain-containing protein [Halomonas icarae]NAW14046.1 excisionase family DNA-binding protein [Halomonas icarae]TDB01723.1 helix-turn-helix domain-containing protein [Halomonas marinisediminis]